MHTITEYIAETLDSSRNLSKFYFDKLQEIDLYKPIEINKTVLNPPLWIIAHLAVSENYLVLYTTHGEMVKRSWAKLFGIGSEIPQKKDYPPLNEILDFFNEVHNNAISHIKQLDPASLNNPLKNDISLAGCATVGTILQHAIRHEANHSGHLGWLCKIYGIKTV